MERLPKYPKSRNSLLNNQRSVILFHSAIKSEKTRQNYDGHLRRFLEYFIIKDYDSLLTINDKKLQTMIEDYLIYLKNQNKSLGLCNGILSSLKLFFEMNDKLLNWTKLKKMLPQKQKTTDDRPYTTEEIRVLLDSTPNPFYKMAIHFMVSSGCRVGVFEELKLKHLTDMPNGCKSVKVYADSSSEYITFIHSESVKALEYSLEFRKNQGEEITPETWVYPNRHDPTKHSDTRTINTVLNRLATKVLTRKKDSRTGRFDVMGCHGFRKRFATILKSDKSINQNLAEKLLGHSSTIPLDNHYFKPTIDALFDEYQKAMPELVIDENYRLRVELKKRDTEIQEIKSKDDRIELLERQLLEVREHLLNISTKS